MRAAGYVLENGDSTRVTVGANSPSVLDLRLVAASPEQFSRQLTNVDWWNSMPGTDAEKDLLVRKTVNCGFCHDMERIMRSRYTAEQFLSVIRRMNTYAVDNTSACGTGSQFSCTTNPPGRAQVSALPEPLDEVSYWGADARELARYLASVNLSGGRSTWPYALKAMSRPSSKASRAVVTVFPVPRQPTVVHDLDVDSKGHVWYGDSGWGYLTRLDPKTGTFTEYAAPKNRTARPGLSPVLGVQDVQVDTEDNVWAVIGGGAMAYFDTKQETWHQFTMPAAPWAFITPFYDRHTETVWTTGRLPGPEGQGPLQAFRLNYKKGAVDAVFPIMVDGGKDVSHPQTIGVYGLQEPLVPFCYQIDRDPDDNFICADFYGSSIITVDAKTGATRRYPTPTRHAAPRRGHADEQGRFWFAEFFGDKVGLFDPNTGSITEFPLSTKYMSAYAAAPDKLGNVWASSNGSDRVVRIDPRTRERIEYLMPVYYDARTLRIDHSAPLTTVWLPNKNLGQLIRIELAE
jgi:streptogramin lyase